ncbi:serine hydrolase [Streptomyces diastatochromogenes]|nr:serine hydrolase [Streptomyces diastatochromogenes]
MARVQGGRQGAHARPAPARAPRRRARPGPPADPEEAADPDLGAAAVAAQAPVWEAGTDHGYHAQTYSWLTGELVRRITGQPVGAWVAEEMAAPVGADLWLGLPAAEQARVGRVGPVEAPRTAGA